LCDALVPEADARASRVEIVDAHLLRLEQERKPALKPRRDQVLDHLGLAVDDDAAPAGEVAERDPVPLAVELERDAVVDEALSLQALPDAGLAQQVDRALLEHAGADPRLAVLAAARLDDHRLDPGELAQPPEREPRGPRPDDADLGAHHSTPSSRSTSCAIAKARFAAGTPQ